ncbi:TPA: hypothetical protein ACTAD5_004587 [Salmonella enterica subsp. enterica serovar Virchow]
MTNKTLEQKIALAQNKLNELKSKQNAISRKERDRLRYALGGDVVKFFKHKQDRELLIGLLSCPFNKEVLEQIRSIGRKVISEDKKS